MVFPSGVNRTLARTGIGFYEMVSAPFPPYDPVFTDHLTPNPVYPDNFKPRLLEDSLFATDTAIGFSGGDIAPRFPGMEWVLCGIAFFRRGRLRSPSKCGTSRGC